MSIKYNEFGEVISVNGITTGQHLGAPTQDAIAEKPEDNKAYGRELSVVTRVDNMVDDKQPTAPSVGGGDNRIHIGIGQSEDDDSFAVFVCDPSTELWEKVSAVDL